MALTQADVDRLEAAVASGTLKVMTDGNMVEYDSAEALLRRLAYVKAVVQGATSAPRTMMAVTTFTRS